MSSSRYLQLDVFPATPGGGNPLGVVVDAEGWNDAQMQRFAAWTNLVETTFLSPARTPDASYRARIFTPTREIPFAGHPTIGSAHAALESGICTPRTDTLIQECGAGLLPIRIDGEGADRLLSVQAPPARILDGNPAAAPLLDAVLNDCKLGALKSAYVEGGRRWWVAEFASEAALRAWSPDHGAILKLAKASDSLGLCVFARSTGSDHDVAVRAFPAGVGIVEDPASGAANGLIAAFVAQREPDGPLARGYRVSQGREMAHDASILIRIDDRGAVWVGGRTQTIVSGNVHWDDPA